MKQRSVIGFILVVVLAYYPWLIFASGDWFRTHHQNACNRAALLKIREDLRLGDGYEMVLRRYWQHASDDLTLYSGNPRGWSVSMPLEFGATDWALLLEFTNGKLSAIKIRTADGPYPPDAPADITAVCDLRSDFDVQILQGGPIP